MMEPVYKITLADGSELKGLGRWAAYYVSNKRLTLEDFEGKTDFITVSMTFEGVTESEDYFNAEVSDIYDEDEKTFFAFRFLTDEALELKALNEELAAVQDGLFEVADLAAANEAELDDVISAIIELAELIGG